MVEGAPLLRAYTLTGIEGSNPFLLATVPFSDTSIPPIPTNVGIQDDSQDVR